MPNTHDPYGSAGRIRFEMTFKLTHSLAGAEMLVHHVIYDFAHFFSGCLDSLFSCFSFFSEGAHKAFGFSRAA